MKQVVFILISALVGHAAFALSPLACNPDKATIIKTAETAEAQQLLPKIAQLAPQAALNNGQGVVYVETLKTLSAELGSPQMTAEVRQLCDLFPQMAALDPVLKNQPGPLRQFYVEVKHGFPPRLLRDGSSNVLVSTELVLKARIITTATCADPFTCTDILQVYVDGVASNTIRGYQTKGGYSSSGGGGG